MLTAGAAADGDVVTRRVLRVLFLLVIFIGVPYLLAELIDIQRGRGAYAPVCRQPAGFWILFERCDGEDHDALIHAFLTAMAGAVAAIMTPFERSATRRLLRTASLVAIGVGGAAAVMGLIGLTSWLETSVAAVTFGGAILAALGGLGLSRFRDTTLLPALSVFVLCFSGVLMWSLFWELPA